MTEVQPTDKPSFDDNDTEWQCCCQCTHVAKGVKAIMILTYIGSLMYFLSFVVSFILRSESSTVTPLVECLLSLIQAIFMSIALSKVNANYLIPTIVLHVISLLMIVLAIVLTVGAILFGGSKVLPPSASSSSSTSSTGASGTVALLVFVLYGIYFGISVWLLAVICKCYRYLKEKRMHLQSQAAKTEQ